MFEIVKMMFYQCIINGTVSLGSGIFCFVAFSAIKNGENNSDRMAIVTQSLKCLISRCSLNGI